LPQLDEKAAGLCSAAAWVKLHNNDASAKPKLGA
jgi:hypothetical protein